MKPLIERLDTCASGDLSDEYLAMAYTIEQSLISAGAVPGEDYTILDLYKLAQPFILELFRVKDRMTYSYPAETVIPP